MCSICYIILLLLLHMLTCLLVFFHILFSIYILLHEYGLNRPTYRCAAVQERDIWQCQPSRTWWWSARRRHNITWSHAAGRRARARQQHRPAALIQCCKIQNLTMVYVTPVGQRVKPALTYNITLYFLFAFRFLRSLRIRNVITCTARAKEQKRVRFHQKSWDRCP